VLIFFCIVLLCCILPGQLRKAVTFGINNLPEVPDDRQSKRPDDRGAYREKRREAR
jgi:hypothetical protein